MDKNAGLRALQAKGLTPIGAGGGERSWACIGFYTRPCTGCGAWLAKGGVQIVRYATVRSGRRDEADVTVSRVFCTDCALERKYVGWLPGWEPTAEAAIFQPPWKGKGAKPVRMVRYGTKWEVE